jgi:hypothetical protein
VAEHPVRPCLISTEERSSHISFAAPVDRLRELMTDAKDQPPDPAAAQHSTPATPTEDMTTFTEFIRPLADSSESRLGDHGALSTNARQVTDLWLSPALRRARSDAQRQGQISLADAFGRPLKIGEPVRIPAVRIDQTDTFFTGRRGGQRGDRLPWFVAWEAADAPTAAVDRSTPGEPPTPLSSVEDLGSI